MKILILHQPFPMGNYRLMPYIATKLQKQGHEVLLTEQLNGRNWNEQTLKIITDQNFDAAYFEMLDGQTFTLLEKTGIKKKVLCYASKGIFNSFEDIIKYHNKYYTDVLTNSKVMSELFTSNNIKNEFFEYYPAPILIEEIVSKDIYKLPIVYLGGGFQRLVKPEYKVEADLIYNNEKIAKFGNGWGSTKNYRGVLPPTDIGSLYFSADISIGTIEPSQRAKGMVNNRYSEMFKSGATVASITYPEVDFYGGEEFITFVNSKEELNNVKVISESKRDAQQIFIQEKEKKFFNSLQNLLTD